MAVPAGFIVDSVAEVHFRCHSDKGLSLEMINKKTPEQIITDSVLKQNRTVLEKCTHLYDDTQGTIDELRKSRGLHSVSAYRHGLYI